MSDANRQPSAKDKYASYGFQRLSDLVTNKNGTYGAAFKNESDSFLNVPKNDKTVIGYDTLTEEEANAYSPSINWAKVWRVKFGNVGGWDNWRNSSINHITKVNDNVYLISEKNELNIEMNYKYSDVDIDKMTDIKSLSKVKDYARGARGTVSTMAGFLNKSSMNGIMTSNYSGLKGLDGISPITVPGSITFSFYFGQAGLYDATQEVVIPILAMMGCVAPFNGSKDYPHMFTGQTPAAAYLIGQILRSVVDNGPEVVSELIDAVRGALPAGEKDGGNDEKGTSLVENAKSFAVGAAEKMITAAMSINDTIYKALDASYSSIASSQKMAYFKLGVMEIGPCYIEKTSFNFDYAATDSKGMPTKGTITYSGITTPLISTAPNLRTMLNSQFDATLLPYEGDLAHLKTQQETVHILKGNS